MRRPKTRSALLSFMRSRKDGDGETAGDSMPGASTIPSALDVFLWMSGAPFSQWGRTFDLVDPKARMRAAEWFADQLRMVQEYTYE